MQSEQNGGVAEERPETTTPTTVARWWPRHLAFFAALVALLVAWFALFRVGLMVRNSPAVNGLSWSERLAPFAVGWRFDLATACYIAAPLAILAAIPGLSPLDTRRGRRVLFWGTLLFIGGGSYLLLAEFEFFKEFQVRYNQLALQYLDHPGTVVSMVWNGYPVVRYTLLWLAVVVAFAFAVRWLIRLVYGKAPQVLPITRGVVFGEIATLFVLAAGLVIGMRGGLQGEPLRWGDAFKNDNDVINQLSLNGVYCIARAAIDDVFRHDSGEFWAKRMKPDDAQAKARELMFDDDERMVSVDRAADAPTMLRTGVDNDERWLKLKPGVTRPNVVVVLMESFSARMSTNISGGYKGAGYTPEFDKVSQEGVLFTRAFSVGTHTHQGIFGTMLSFPNLPGYEALMQSSVANQHFTSLPSIFSDAGYQTLFLYNGSFSWDNMEGFFRKQGIDRFIGRDDFPPEARTDGTWGVNDRQVFDRANDEFEAAAKKGPFFGFVLTLSNHSPFLLPDPLPFEPTKGFGEMDRRLNAVRYADWAFGRFIEGAKQREYFKNTVFVFVGDHGFSIEPKVTAANLLYHHICMLWYGPHTIDAPPSRQDFTVSQLNIAPSLLGLLHMDAPRAFWGRDIFRTDARTENVAIFKSSSGDNVLAMAHGDRVLVLDAKATPKLYGFDLGPDPKATEITGPEVDAERERMATELKAVVQSALTDLRAMRAGRVRGTGAPGRASPVSTPTPPSTQPAER